MSFSTTMQTTLSPTTQLPVVERAYPATASLNDIIEASQSAYLQWRTVALTDRIALVERFIAHLVALAPELALEITEQMGRPIRYTKGEIVGLEERARWLCSNAESALKDENVDQGRPLGLKRVIRRSPVGVTLLIGAWNFPYLVQVNSLIPALLAGNSILLKPSPQTPTMMERVLASLLAVGLPKNVCQVLHLTPAQLDLVVAHPLVNFISFTGSVAVGKHVEITASRAAGFKSVGLELGGKDAAYVRKDVDVRSAAENIVDGACFNSGQSCCAVERVYVHESIYDEFVMEAVRVLKEYVLGDPREESTTIGPVVSLRSAANIRAHIADAVSKGAKALVDSTCFPLAKDGSTFVAPQVLVDVDHSMLVMIEETFGPVMGIMKVNDDAEAVRLINDSPYGLTCSVWTKDEDVFASLVDSIDVGTVFMNRCDYLDPALAWTGVKDSGRGISLSRYGFDAVTRAKSIHIRSTA